MTPEELVQAARLTEAMEALKAQVRDAPADASRRFFLFQMLAIDGQWDRALTQLNVAAELDAHIALFAHAGRRLLQAEAFREQVFSGVRSPIAPTDCPNGRGLEARGSARATRALHS